MNAKILYAGIIAALFCASVPTNADDRISVQPVSVKPDVIGSVMLDEDGVVLKVLLEALAAGVPDVRLVDEEILREIVDQVVTHASVDGYDSRAIRRVIEDYTALWAVQVCNSIGVDSKWVGELFGTFPTTVEGMTSKALLDHAKQIGANGIDAVLPEVVDEVMARFGTIRIRAWTRTGVSDAVKKMSRMAHCPWLVTLCDSWGVTCDFALQSCFQGLRGVEVYPVENAGGLNLLVIDAGMPEHDELRTSFTRADAIAAGTPPVVLALVSEGQADDVPWGMAAFVPGQTKGQGEDDRIIVEITIPMDQDAQVLNRELAKIALRWMKVGLDVPDLDFGMPRLGKGGLTIGITLSGETGSVSSPEQWTDLKAWILGKLDGGVGAQLGGRTQKGIIDWLRAFASCLFGCLDGFFSGDGPVTVEITIGVPPSVKVTMESTMAEVRNYIGCGMKCF